MLEAADREGRIHLHVHASDEKKRLQPDHIITAISGAPLQGTHIVMCGPNSLVKSMKSGLRRHGARHMHVEGFDMRSGFGPDLSRHLDEIVRTQLRRFVSTR
jgi:ferredoxin-NADP reductase